MAQKTHADEVAGFSPEQLDAARRLVDRIVRGRTEIARIEAEILRAMTELADIAHEAGREAPTSDGPEYTRRAMAAEVAAATRVHPQTARAQMEDAERITQDYPQTLRSLEQGCVSLSHARVIADAGRNLEPGARASLDACAVPFAETRTPGELCRITRKQAVDLQTSSPRERHEVARRDRRVSLTELDDGMSELNVVAPTFEVRTLYDRLTTMARRVKMDRRRARSAFIREHGRTPEEMVAGPGYESPSGTPGESRRSSLSGDFSPSGNAAQAEGPTATRGSVGSVTQLTGLADGLARADVGASDVRTFDQLRADILCDLVLTAAPTGHELHASDTTEALRNVAANVQVTIPVEQLLDPDSGASWVDDGALISPQTARAVAAEAPGWDRLFIRPESGEVVAVDRYRPSSEQRRMLRARDMTCRFPGCTTTARRSDIDHSHDYARGGPTAVENLSVLCESHHTVKHVSGWTPVQLGGGLIEWFSPLGYTYRDEPRSCAFFRDTVARESGRSERLSGGENARRAHRERRRERQRADERRAEERSLADEQRADRLAEVSSPPPLWQFDWDGENGRS